MANKRDSKKQNEKLTEPETKGSQRPKAMKVVHAWESLIPELKEMMGKTDEDIAQYVKEGRLIIHPGVFPGMDYARRMGYLE